MKDTPSKSNLATFRGFSALTIVPRVVIVLSTVVLMTTVNRRPHVPFSFLFVACSFFAILLCILLVVLFCYWLDAFWNDAGVALGLERAALEEFEEVSRGAERELQAIVQDSQSSKKQFEMAQGLLVRKQHELAARIEEQQLEISDRLEHDIAELLRGDEVADQLYNSVDELVRSKKLTLVMLAEQEALEKSRINNSDESTGSVTDYLSKKMLAENATDIIPASSMELLRSAGIFSAADINRQAIKILPNLKEQLAVRQWQERTEAEAKKAVHQLSVSPLILSITDKYSHEKELLENEISALKQDVRNKREQMNKPNAALQQQVERLRSSADRQIGELRGQSDAHIATVDKELEELLLVHRANLVSLNDLSEKHYLRVKRCAEDWDRAKDSASSFNSINLSKYVKTLFFLNVGASPQRAMINKAEAESTT